jgi:hypothetical protein
VLDNQLSDACDMQSARYPDAADVNCIRCSLYPIDSPSAVWLALSCNCVIDMAPICINKASEIRLLDRGRMDSRKSRDIPEILEAVTEILRMMENHRFGVLGLENAESCLTGVYPTPIDGQHKYKHQFRRRRPLKLSARRDSSVPD